MSASRISAKHVAAGLIALLLIALSIPLLPVGSTSYVVPRGASMEPRVSGGDLAVVRAETAYRVGDVAAYRNTALHRVVVHRIVAIDGDVYTFKGDANDFVDPQQVTRGQIVGRLSVSLPLLGSVLLWLSSPLNALLLLALLALLVRDRVGLLASLRRTPAAPATATAPAGEQPSGFDVDDDRLIPIRDMSFPHELAVADVVRPESLLRLAERYDRPVLHDEENGVLFVVESSMLFRCELAQAAVAAAPLAVVRDLAPEAPQTLEDWDATAEWPLEDVEPLEEPLEEPLPEPVVEVPIEMRLPSALPAPDILPMPAAYEPRHERERRHNWPRRRDYGGRRKPSPYGRDWSYAAGK
jgi:signal peptidase I